MAKSVKIQKDKKEAVIFKSPQRKNVSFLFPKIYRFITEKWKLILSCTVSAVILIAIVFQSVSLFRAVEVNQAIKAKRGSVERELAFWKDQIDKYKDSRDIHFQIAVLEYELGDEDSARANLQKVLEIDPNFKKGREMKLKLKM